MPSLKNKKQKQSNKGGNMEVSFTNYSNWKRYISQIKQSGGPDYTFVYLINTWVLRMWLLAHYHILHHLCK